MGPHVLCTVIAKVAWGPQDFPVAIPEHSERSMFPAHPHELWFTPKPLPILVVKAAEGVCRHHSWSSGWQTRPAYSEKGVLTLVCILNAHSFFQPHVLHMRVSTHMQGSLAPGPKANQCFK